MSALEIVFLAVGLSMDAFAVAITLGLSVQKAGLKELVIPGLYFGVFQALMPLLGYVLGISFAEKISNIDHWVAFGLLGCIGGKMIKESFAQGHGERRGNPFRVFAMLTWAVATSIDALAVGITFAFFKVAVIPAMCVIGGITGGLSVCGVKVGSVFGLRFKAKAERAGGAVLVLLGCKILVEHLFLAS
jgi:putative Mn2+ efflux pump MntP